MSRKVLFTIADEDADRPVRFFQEKGWEPLHLPLERYVAVEDSDKIQRELNRLEEYQNIVYGRKRNALFFMEQVEQRDKWESVRNRLNLALHQETADYLEDRGIPAVLPGEETTGIKLVEFMLRLQRYGKTLYPCGNHESEDIPGFLQELDIEVTELPLFDLEGPDDEQLEEFQQQVTQEQPDTVIFHNRRSVNRILAAFPDLEYKKLTVVSADSAITEKLEDNEVEPDIVAAGSWKSIVEKLE